MKKRRELDALVSGVKGQKNGRHELLRNESESSEEVEEFAMPQKTVVRKRVKSQCCSTFATMCWVFLLSICVISIGGLIWMVIQLKNDLTELQNSAMKAERAQPNLRQLALTQTEMKEKIEQLSSDETGFPRLQANLSDWSKKLTVLNSTVGQLAIQMSSRQPAADKTSEIQDLQEKTRNLLKAIADIGSSVEETKQQQTSMVQQLTDMRSDIAALQLTSISRATLTTKPPVFEHERELLLQHMQQEIRQLTSEVTSVNETLCGKIRDLSDLIYTQNISITVISNTSALTSRRLAVLERRPSSGQLEEKAVVDLVKMEIQKYLNGSSEEQVDTEVLNHLQAKFDSLQSAETNRTAVIAALVSTFSSTSKRLNALSALVAHNEKLLNETISRLAARHEEGDEVKRELTPKPLPLAEDEEVDETVPSNEGSTVITSSTDSSISVSSMLRGRS